MSGAPEEPPDSAEVPGPSESSQDPSAVVGEVCEGNKSQLETFKDIMLKTRTDLRKKEEELQEYASKLSEIKSRSKRTRRSKDATSSSVETTPRSRRDDGSAEPAEDAVDDISLAKTPKAKSSLLQRKLAENRKKFEQRSKEMTESKRAVEEKVEAIRQQMDQTELTIAETHKDSLLVTPVRPVLITSQTVSPTDVQVGLYPDKDDNKITELNNRILELEAMVIDLQENLREKDSVIESKTRAVTLMSADLSKKGKSTLDTLEDTKDEMRTMQENFVLIETSLRGKNENLLEQLQERNDRVTDLEATIGRYEQEMEAKRLAETASASLSRATMDTLADTKDEMRSMQENFVLIETSLREKNNNLLQQLEERETRLAEAVEKIYKLESGAGIAAAPEVPDLRYRIEKLERSNVALQDEKFELQKSIVELQEKIVARESTNGNGLIIEKDNRIAELENLIEELKNSNQLLEEESKAELQKQVDELAARNDEFRTKIDDLERLNNDLETEKNELIAKLPDDSGVTKEDSMVEKLKKELEDLNKSMIKLKAQHKSKLRNLQKQLESFKAVSDANAELVKLGNQVALLEEEKGNLQLSLVDFDELKASAGDWQDRIADLESKVSAQANDIQAHVEAIAILENQKLDLMQDLHSAKQEISSLEAENAESENLRVSAEMKIVDVEEQLESLHRMRNESATSRRQSADDTSDESLRKIEQLSRENVELVRRIAKLEEKPSSEAGSTESFETINEDRNELTRRIETLSARNAELEERLSRIERASRSNVGSIEHFETINDDTTDRNELVKRIDILSRENSDLVARLNKFEEKGSSDTGSTESFEKIPEHVDNASRIEILTRENSELVVKLAKLEEKMDVSSAARLTEDSPELVERDDSFRSEEKLRVIVEENNALAIELTKLREKLSRVVEEKAALQDLADAARRRDEILEEAGSRVASLTAENVDLSSRIAILEEMNARLKRNYEDLGEAEAAACRKDREDVIEATRRASIVTVDALEAEIATYRESIGRQSELVDQLRTKLAATESELEARMAEIADYEARATSAESLRRELKENSGMIDEWRYKCEIMEKNMETLESDKIAIEEGLRVLREENMLLREETRMKDANEAILRRELDETIANFSVRFDEERGIAVEQEREMEILRDSLRSKDRELHEKYALLRNEMISIDSLQDELNERRAQQRANETIVMALNEELRGLREKIIVEQERHSACDAEIASLREELSTKAAKEARNELIVDEMTSSMNDRARENESLRTLVDGTRAELENARARLAAKETEIAALLEEKTFLDDQIRDSRIAKEAALDSLESMQRTLDDGAGYAEDLNAELSNAYRMLELLKTKHTEDADMLNRRLEDLVEVLNETSSERDSLSVELTARTRMAEDLETRLSELAMCRERLVEKEILVGRNVTESTKIDLELRVKELEEKLSESEANTQTQLQKRKILAANLKKKSAQYEELEARAAEYEARVRELEPKAQEFESRARELEAIVAELEARSDEFEAKASRSEIREGELEAEIIQLEAKVRELEASVAQLEPRAASFETKASELEIRALEFETQARELAIKAAEFEARAESSNARVAELEAAASLYEGRALELEARNAELEAKVAELRSRVSVYEDKIAELRSRSAELEARSVELEARVVELASELSNSEAKTMELRSRSAELEARVVELASELSNSEAKTMELRSRSAELEARVVELASELSNSEAKTMEFRSGSAELEARVVELASELSNSEAKTMEFRSRSAELEARVVELASELSNSEAKTMEFRSRSAELDARVVELASELSNSEAKTMEFRSRSAELDARVVELASELSNSEARAADLASRSAELASELSNSEARAADLASRSAELEATNVQLDSAVSAYSARASDLSSHNVELEARAVQLETAAAASRSRASNLEATMREVESRANSLELKASELEARVIEFQDKWLSEKSEKDEANRRLRETELSCRASNETLARLEDQLASARSEAAESLDRAQALSSELHDSAEKIASLTSRVTEKLEETERLRAEMEHAGAELASERRARESLTVELEGQRRGLMENFELERRSLIGKFDDERRALVDERTEIRRMLDDARENARELGVRMQVMESEYVERLNTIQTLRTENGMLVSKQAQISERLENAEKEASEGKILLDRVQRENAERTPEIRREVPAVSAEDDERSRNDEKQPCDQCDQCQTVVQALEAKLQERDAEIENLDNELANSIGNFVHMRESLRVSDLMNQSTSRSRGLEESRENELALQYSALAARNDELGEQLSRKIRENEELNEKIVSLEALNAALRERTVAVEEELVGDRDAEPSNASNDRLRENLQTRDAELLNARSELESMRSRHEERLEAARAQIQRLEAFNAELTRTRDDSTRSRSQAETEMAELRERSVVYEREIMELREKLERSGTEDSPIADFMNEEPRAASSLFAEETNDAPKLFDAEKLFGPSVATDATGQQLVDLRNALAGKDRENAALAREAKRLAERIVALESQAWETRAIDAREVEISRNECQRLEIESAELRDSLAERNRRIESLTLELNNVGARLAEQFDRRETDEATERSVERSKARNAECADGPMSAEETIGGSRAENAELAEKLEKVRAENARSIETLDLVVSLVNDVLGDSGDRLRGSSQLDNLSPAVRSCLFAIANYRDFASNEIDALRELSNRYASRIAELEEEEARRLNDSTRIRELEERVDRVTRERDAKQLRVNDLTRSLEESRESTESPSAREEARLRDLRGSLDQALAENDRLNLRLDALSRETETRQLVEAGKLKVCETSHVAQTEKLISCEIAESRMVGSSGVEVPPLVQESGWDEEALSWNPEDAQLAEGRDLISRDELRLNLERRLNTRIAELEDTIRDLGAERERLVEEMKLIQVRDGKLVRKLKEFKIQNESLQQQLKIQKATVEFCDLDTAIEEELKAQIAKLEKALDEASEEVRKAGLERGNLTKRIDVLTAANERLVEMKERQDMEMEMLKIGTRELTNKLESMDWQLREACDVEACDVVRTDEATFSEEPTKVRAEVATGEALAARIVCACDKYRAEIEELRDEIEALATENEQMQKLLEEQRAARLANDSKFNELLSESAREIEELSRRNGEMVRDLEEARDNYESLASRCDREANDSRSEIATVRQSHDALKAEAAEMAANFEAKIGRMRDEGNSAIAEIDRLGENVRALLVEREELARRTKSHEETLERLAVLEESMTELTDLLNSRVQEVAELKREIQRSRADRKEALAAVEDQAQSYSRELSLKNEANERHALECEALLDERNHVIGQLRERLSSSELETATCRANAENLRREIERSNVAAIESESLRDSLRSELASKERELFRLENEARRYAGEEERLDETLARLHKSSYDQPDESNRRIAEFETSEASLGRTVGEPTTDGETEAAARLGREIGEKDPRAANLRRTVLTLEEKLEGVASSSLEPSNEEIRHLRATVDELRRELNRRNGQIEDYRYQLSESTYPVIMQALQDQVNALYEEKSKVEQSLEAAMGELSRQRELAERSTVSHQTRRLMSSGTADDFDETIGRVDDDEVQSLKTEIDERIERFQNLHDRYENAEIEINELRLRLAARDNEIAILRRRFDPTGIDGESLVNVPRQESPGDEIDEARASEIASIKRATTERVSNELDLALYMLHHRDVRCEELTHELMQLLEERDTLQLRLSNAIRINEELRRSLPIEPRSGEAVQEIHDVEPLVEKASPSRSAGPVEIAKEAIDAPNEDKIALAQKLSQLHNTGHRRDVRLLDDRESRHNQQMSLLAHRDVLSTLPPEAAAKLVNANYTLSRDVQSQSSVLMNWLWGKSTPKVVHM